MNRHSGHYIHGSEPEEQRRLALLNQLLNQNSLDALRLSGDERVLDVGCGLGQLTRAIARRLGPGKVVGVERDPDQLAEARRLARADDEVELVDFRLGDAIELPLSPGERGTFDVAHSRFLLEHLPRPRAVVAAMVAAVRPGGRVIVEDDDHDLLRLWPEVPGFDRLWRAYLSAYDRLGNDPYVGRRLVAMLREAGAEPVRNDMHFFGSCAGHRSFRAFVDNFAGLIEGAPQTILDGGSLRRAELDQGLTAIREWAGRPEAALWYVTCWAEGRRGPDSGGAPPPAAQPAPDTAALRPRRKLTSMEFLIESAADLNSSLRLGEVFRKIADRVRELIDCHLFCVALWNEDAQLLEHSYSLKFGRHVEQEGGFPLGTGISGSAAAERRPIRVPDVSKDPRYVRARHAEVEIRSELAVPLVVGDRLIGTLDLESQELDAFSEEHERIVVALASQIATALENARLYEELRAKELRLERDLDTARQIQKALLPAHPPRLERLDVGAAFAAASELSGDFYDFLHYRDGRVGFALGDVAGKSTAAALYGSLAVGMLRGYALEHVSTPEELLTHLNRELHALAIARRFVALGFALYDPADGSLTVGNAGIPQPLLVRSGRVRALAISGVPLGGLADARYQVERLALEPGDLVAFFSDGVETFRDDAAALLGERLAALAWKSAQEAADGLLEATSDIGTGQELSDDRTVVILKAV